MAISLDSPPKFCQFFGFPPPGEGDSLALWTPPSKIFPNLSPPTDLGARPCMAELVFNKLRFKDVFKYEYVLYLVVYSALNLNSP